MDIYNLGNTLYTNYIVVKDGTAILIDFGNNVSYESLLKRLEKRKTTQKSIAYALLTHAHCDHVSYLEAFMKQSEATLICHKNAPSALLSGEDNLDTYYSSVKNRKLSELTARLRGGPAKWESVDVTHFKHLFVDSDTRLDSLGATLITLEGHTNDCIGIAFDSGECFIGDALMNSVPAKNLLPLLIADRESFIDSYKKLIALDAKLYYVGHGAPLTKSDLQKNLCHAEALTLC